MSKKALFLLVSLLIVHCFLLINLRFEAWPEMLVYPYLMHHGYTLYRDLINPYPPLGLWLLSGFFKLVGLSLTHLQFLTLGLIMAIDILIYSIAKKKYGPKAALIALGFFILFQPLLDGNGLWFDLLLVPLLLIAYYRQSPFFLAISFFIKQSVIWLFPLFFKKIKMLVIFLGSLFLVSCFLFLLSGTLKEYLFWVWKFPFTIFPFTPGHKDFGNWHLWLIGMFPVLVAIYMQLLSRHKTLKSTQDPFWWMIACIPFVFPRFGLFHFQPALAFAALSFGQSWKTIKKTSWLPLLLIPCSLFLIIIWRRQIMTFWHQPTRFFDPQIVAEAHTVAAASHPDQPLLFINTPSQTLFLANRLPLKPWADTFSWYLETDDLQLKIIAALEKNPQTLIVHTLPQNEGQFVPGSYEPPILMQYLKQKFPFVTMLSTAIELRSSMR